MGTDTGSEEVRARCCCVSQPSVSLNFLHFREEVYLLGWFGWGPPCMFMSSRSRAEQIRRIELAFDWWMWGIDTATNGRRTKCGDGGLICSRYSWVGLWNENGSEWSCIECSACYPCHCTVFVETLVAVSRFLLLDFAVDVSFLV